MSKPFSEPEKNRCQGFKSRVLMRQANQREPSDRLCLPRALKVWTSTFEVDN
jgi:hypothetical protein